MKNKCLLVILVLVAFLPGVLFSQLTANHNSVLLESDSTLIEALKKTLDLLEIDADSLLKIMPRRGLDKARLDSPGIDIDSLLKIMMAHHQTEKVFRNNANYKYDRARITIIDPAFKQLNRKNLLKRDKYGLVYDKSGKVNAQLQINGFRQDSIWFAKYTSESFEYVQSTVPYDYMQSVKVSRDNLWGVVGGFLVGFTVGAAVGLAIEETETTVSGTKPSPFSLSGTRTNTTSRVTNAGAVAASVIGFTLVGVLVGNLIGKGTKRFKINGDLARFQEFRDFVVNSGTRKRL